MTGDLERFDAEAELAWLVDPTSPAPTPAELVRQSLGRGLPLVVDGLVRLALTAESERTRFDAAKYIVALAGLLGVTDVSGTGLDDLVRRIVDGGPGTAAA
jgi:hypothetical protein